MDAMQDYREGMARVKALDPTTLAWYRGYIVGLLYAQAQNETEERPTIIVDFPQGGDAGLPGEQFDPQVFLDVLRYDVDDEGGVVSVHMWIESHDFNPPLSWGRIEIAGTEGVGIPKDWDSRPNMAPQQVKEALK